MNFERHVASDPAALAEMVAAFICACCQSDAPVLSICLSGGETPRATYSLLAKLPYRGRLPWHRIHWFFTDERMVAPDDQRSNLHMCSEALFEPAGVSGANIHPIPTLELDASQAALAYGEVLKRHYRASSLDPARPFFDLVLLGLGVDGHTASLFPNNPALQERADWTAAVRDPSVPEPRVTLTLPLLGSSRRTAFLVEGSRKAGAVSRLLAGDAAIPASHVPAPAGGMDIFMDEAAAGGVSA